MGPKRVVILGATGSIGSQTLDCIRQANREEPETYSVVGLSARRNIDALAALAVEWPRALLACPSLAEKSSKAIRSENPYEELLEKSRPDIVVNGIAGSAGLAASLASLKAGVELALANKESVVMAFRLMEETAAKSGAAIIPVDSEHSALFQLSRRIGKSSISEYTITASGGPFRERPLSELDSIDPDEAAAHPVWKMGRKISIDSATMANKGLELIEAARLFSIPMDRLRVLVHPESYAHALVRVVDGSLYANISKPDMRLPINIALSWPAEKICIFGSLDLAGKTLRFFEPESCRYPMVDLARRAFALGEAGTIAYNAADETAVAAFEDRRIKYTDIARVVETTLSAEWDSRVDGLDSIFYFDALARERASKVVVELGC